jgi:dihydrofolate reductase
MLWRKRMMWTRTPFIVGGEQIYRLALTRTKTVYLTRVHYEFDGDRRFPELSDFWEEVRAEFHPKDDKHIYSFTITKYKRRDKA